MVSFCAQLGYDLIQHPLPVLMPVYLHTQKAFMESVFYANVFYLQCRFVHPQHWCSNQYSFEPSPNMDLNKTFIAFRDTDLGLEYSPFWQVSKRNNRSIIRHTLGSGGYPLSIISASISVALGAKLPGGRGMFSNGTLGSHASCISDSMLGFLYNLCRWTKLFNASCHVWIFGDQMSNMHITEIFVNLAQLAFHLKAMPARQDSL